MDFEKTIVKDAEKLGAYKAYVIDVAKIPFDEGLREYCEVNYCGSYGKNHACPPSVGDVKTVIKKAKTYNRALIFQTVTGIEDSYDFEGMEQADKNHTKLASDIEKIFSRNMKNYLQLTAGSCKICSKCTQEDDLPCRYPDRAVSSLEAYCMNVSDLASLCGMKYINGQNTVTYFGAFLF